MAELSAPTLAAFDPLSQAFLSSPDEILRRAREDAPVAYIPELGIWAITRYADVTAAYSDFNTFSSDFPNAPAIPAKYVDRVPSDFFPPTHLYFSSAGSNMFLSAESRQRQH